MTLAPFLFFVFWIGLGAQPFIDLIHVSVENLLNNYHGFHNQLTAVSNFVIQ